MQILAECKKTYFSLRNSPLAYIVKIFLKAIPFNFIIKEGKRPLQQRILVELALKEVSLILYLSVVLYSTFFLLYISSMSTVLLHSADICTQLIGTILRIVPSVPEGASGVPKG